MRPRLNARQRADEARREAIIEAMGVLGAQADRDALIGYALEQERRALLRVWQDRFVATEPC